MALYLVAQIAGRAVAFAAQDVESAVDLGPVTPVPRALPGVVGMAALRSRVATVIDPKVILGLASDGSTTARAVVSKADGHLYAVLVDALEDVAEYRAMPLPPGVVLDDRWARAADTIIDRDGEPVLVVSLSHLVAMTEPVGA